MQGNTDRPTSKGLTMSKKGAREATEAVIDDRPDHEKYPHDPAVPWSQAWLADQLARTDSQLRRVKNSDDCCAGLTCMHYVKSAVQRVRGKGAARSKGVAIGYDDAAMYLRGVLGL